jgi:leader peptidase (prepilin peptidase)/N-methyltransferase
LPGSTTGRNPRLDRGSRCPTCASPFTASRWLYITAGASAFTLLAASLPHRRPGELVLLAAWLVFAAAGTLLSAIDIHAKRLPTTIIVPAAAVVGVLVIAAAVTSHQLSIARTSAAAATVGLAYLALALLEPASVGMGDVRLAALSGLLLGTHGWGTVLIGAVLPHLLAAAAVTVLQLTGRRVHRQTEIPFGPCLVTGAVLAPSVHAAAM